MSTSFDNNDCALRSIFVAKTVFFELTRLWKCCMDAEVAQNQVDSHRASDRVRRLSTAEPARVAFRSCTMLECKTASHIISSKQLKYTVS